MIRPFLGHGVLPLLTFMPPVCWCYYCLRNNRKAWAANWSESLLLGKILLLQLFFLSWAEFILNRVLPQ